MTDHKIKKNEYERINALLGFTGANHEAALKWFIQQGFTVREKILKDFLHKFLPDSLGNDDIYLKFLETIRDSGWKISTKLKSKRNLSRNELQIADKNTIEQALEFTKLNKRRRNHDRLLSHYGLIKQLHEDKKMSYNSIASFIKNKYKIQISGQALRRLYLKIENKK